MDNLFKEDLSLAYLQAICAKSGITMNVLKRDEDGADVSLKLKMNRQDGTPIIATIEAQLKSTSSKSFYTEDDLHISYYAKKKCYNDLVVRRITPLYLLLLILPEADDDCVIFNIDSLVLKRCMYWAKLEEGSEKTDNAFEWIEFDKNHALSPEELYKIMEMEGNNL